jgi:hypothetical protein
LQVYPSISKLTGISTEKVTALATDLLQRIFPTHFIMELCHVCSGSFVQSGPSNTEAIEAISSRLDNVGTLEKLNATFASAISERLQAKRFEQNSSVSSSSSGGAGEEVFKNHDNLINPWF